MTGVRRWHLWFGLVTAVGVIVVSLTGILLNHRAAFGLWDPPAPEAPGTIDAALPLTHLMRGAVLAAHQADIEVEWGPRSVNRLLYRPDGTAAVRVNDRRATEVVLDAISGAVLQVAPRDDVTVEHLHSGELAGQRAVVLSDLVAVVLIGLVVTGAALWLRRLRRDWGGPGQERTPWMRANRWFHLVGGLVVGVLAVALSVTGILLNHKRELGFMVEPARVLDAEAVAPVEPARLEQISGWAQAEYRRVVDDDTPELRWIDYRPLLGYAKVRYDSGVDTEVVVDVYDGKVLSVAQRRDLWLERLHSGELFGRYGVLLSDGAAVGLILLTLNGLYLWMWPAWRARNRAASLLDERAEATDRLPVGR